MALEELHDCTVDNKSSAANGTSVVQVTGGVPPQTRTFQTMTDRQYQTFNTAIAGGKKVDVAWDTATPDTVQVVMVKK